MSAQARVKTCLVHPGPIQMPGNQLFSSFNDSRFESIEAVPKLKADLLGISPVSSDQIINEFGTLATHFIHLARLPQHLIQKVKHFWSLQDFGYLGIALYRGDLCEPVESADKIHAFPVLHFADSGPFRNHSVS